MKSILQRMRSKQHAAEEKDEEFSKIVIVIDEPSPVPSPAVSPARGRWPSDHLWTKRQLKLSGSV